jgi:hypothetical protein
VIVRRCALYAVTVGAVPLAVGYLFSAAFGYDVGIAVQVGVAVFLLQMLPKPWQHR